MRTEERKRMILTIFFLRWWLSMFCKTSHRKNSAKSSLICFTVFVAAAANENMHFCCLKIWLRIYTYIHQQIINIVWNIIHLPLATIYIVCVQFLYVIYIFSCFCFAHFPHSINVLFCVLVVWAIHSLFFVPPLFIWLPNEFHQIFNFRRI